MRVDDYAKDHELVAVGTAAAVIAVIVAIVNYRKGPALTASAVASGVTSALTHAGVVVGAGNMSGSGVIGTGGGAIAGGAGTGDHSASGSSVPAASSPPPTGSIVFDSAATIWSRTNAGYIGARKTVGTVGATYPVDEVTVPHDPTTGTGGTYYRLLAGPNAGWLVSVTDPSVRRVA